MRFDVVVRAEIKAYTPVEKINSSIETVKNIRLMVERSITFFDEYGPIIKDEFTFEYEGYTSLVNSGNGDFLTEKTLWNFKISKADSTKVATLQLLMYYLIGIRSIHKEFESITQLDIYNPKLNKVYLLNVNDVPNDIIEQVPSNVIGYSN